MNPRILAHAAVLLILSLPGAAHAKGKAVTERSAPEAGARPCTLDNMTRPYVLMTSKRLEALRTETAPGGEKRELYLNGARRIADSWIDRPTTVPARAGHFHHFFCEDGTRLQKTAGEEYGTSRTFACPACGREYRGDPYEAAYRNQEHTQLIEGCRDLALVWAVEQDRRYAAKTAQILLQYADAYPGRHTKNAGADAGGIYWQSLDESMHIVSLAQAYDLIYDSGELTDDQKSHIEKDLFWECGEGLIAMGSRTNWGSWHLSAVGVIGLATRHQRFIDHGVREFKRQIAEELGDDGLWPESVHTYHFFPLGGLLYLTEAAANAGIDLYAYEPKPGKSIRSMFSAPLQYMYPDLRLPAINDGWFASFLPSEQYQIAYARYGDPAFAWAVKKSVELDKLQSNGWKVADHLWTLAIGKTLPEEIPQPKFESINFPVLGICTLRTESEDLSRETMVTFDYGPFLGHGQPDKMGITLFANGRLWAADYGTPGYGSRILEYYKSTAAHNTVMVDGQNQKATKEGGLVRFFPTPEDRQAMAIRTNEFRFDPPTSGPQVQFQFPSHDQREAAAETTEAYPGVTWRRTVQLRGNYILVTDDLSSSAPHTYHWIFRSEGERFSIEGDSVVTSGVNLFRHKYIKIDQSVEPTKNYFGAGWEAESGDGLRLTARGSTPLIAHVGTCPAESGTRQVNALVLEQKGTHARFSVVLIPYRADEKSQLPPPGLARFPLPDICE